MSVVVRWRSRRILVLTLGLVTVACASDPPQFSENRLSAIQWNHQAREAFNQGEYRQALAGYRQALAVSRAIEDVDGVAIELINLATVFQQLGERDEVRRALGEILAPSGLPFAPAHKAEAAYRIAYLHVEAREIREAQGLLIQALDYCRSASCGISGRIHNLTARLLLGTEDHEQAWTQARKGLAVNQGNGDIAEQANSLRLLADVAHAKSDHATAVHYYAQALSLDKRLGAARKIRLDLMGLGNSLARQGRQQEAEDYYRRARLVHEGIDHAIGRGDIPAPSVPPMPR